MTSLKRDRVHGTPVGEACVCRADGSPQDSRQQKCGEREADPPVLDVPKVVRVIAITRASADPARADQPCPDAEDRQAEMKKTS